MGREELVKLGEELRAAREARELTLADVEQQTRIRSKFLESLEAGELDTGLTETQVRGFVRNYAVALRLDPEATVQAYEEAKLPRRRGLLRRTNTPAPTLDPKRTTDTVMAVATEKTESSGGGSVRLLVLGMLALGFLAIAGAGIFLFIDNNNSTADPANPPLVVDVAASDTPLMDDMSTPPTLTPEPTAGGVIVAPQAEQALNANFDSLAIEILATQRTWVQVSIDDVVQFEGLMLPDTQINYEAQDRIDLRTSNAAGIDVFINGRSLGALGEQGTTFEQTFTLTGLLTPTPMASPTVTVAPATPTSDAGAALNVIPESSPTVALPSATPSLVQPQFTIPPAEASPVNSNAGVIIGPTATLQATVTLAQPDATLVQPTAALPSATPIQPTATEEILPTAAPLLPERQTRTPRPDES